ncbi:LOW QUALITY PROTEIN: hepatocyte nuclear factor 1-alpha [Aplochiton taeniatus]
MEGEESKGGGKSKPGRLSALQEQLIWALLGSGLSQAVCPALGDWSKIGVTTGGEKAERGDEESSEEGEMDFPPPIFRDLERLPPEEAARQRAAVDQLLQEDPWRVAKLVKSYMQQHNLPQREVVESTGLNQSHLSQHLNKGTPMKNQKRASLYSWYVKKQGEISQQFTNARHGLGSGEDQGDDVRKGRRNRFKWGPASQQILFHAYEKQKNPSKEEREVLVEDCNRAECHQRGVSPSQLAGLGSNLVTEVRVYNWFANRRKEEAFRHKLALDTPYTSQSASSTNQTLPPSPGQGMKYSQQMTCDILGSARGPSGDRGLGGRLLGSPVQLEPSHTLLETSHHKPVSGGGSLPPVSTLTSLHSMAASPPSQGLIMASLPSVMSLGESSLLIAQQWPVINNMGSGFTTLQPISFQQQLHSSPQHSMAQQFQVHMGQNPFMAPAQLPCHMYSKSDMTPYPPSAYCPRPLVITDSSSLGTLTSLTAVRQILNTDPEEQSDIPIQEDSLHLQSTSPVPVSSGNLDMYSPSQPTDTQQSHLLSSYREINSYIPTQMVSTAQ